MEDKNKNNRIIQSIITTIIVSIVGSLLSFGIGYFSNENGYIHISKSIKTEDNLYITTLKIENNNNKTINDLSFKLNNNGDLLNVYSNYPIEINYKNKNNIEYISLSNLFSDKTFDLLISSKIPYEKNDVEFMNAEEKDFEIVRELQGDIRRKEVVTLGVIASLFYGVMIGLFFYIIKNRQDKYNDKFSKKQEEIEKRNENLEKDSQKINEETKKMQKELHKYKLVLLARLRDYSKELSFWKDTIRKIMYKTDENKNEDRSEKLFKIVTKNLKTFSTRKDVEIDYKTIEILAEIFNYNEKEDGKY